MEVEPTSVYNNDSKAQTEIQDNINVAKKSDRHCLLTESSVQLCEVTKENLLSNTYVNTETNIKEKKTIDKIEQSILKDVPKNLGPCTNDSDSQNRTEIQNDVNAVQKSPINALHYCDNAKKSLVSNVHVESETIIDKNDTIDKIGQCILNEENKEPLLNINLSKDLELTNEINSSNDPNKLNSNGLCSFDTKDYTSSNIKAETSADVKLNDVFNKEENYALSREPELCNETRSKTNFDENFKHNTHEEDDKKIHVESGTKDDKCQIAIASRTSSITRSHKKRRRIIISESNSDMEVECQETQELMSDYEYWEEDTSNSSSDEEIYFLEKPKPKCKKQSTLIKKQLKVQKLLANAIMIPAPPVKRNFSRVIASSSDEKEDDGRTPGAPKISLHCHKRKIFESSSSNASESDSNVLITDPISETNYTNFDIVNEPIPPIVLPSNPLPEEHESESEYDIINYKIEEEKEEDNKSIRPETTKDRERQQDTFRNFNNNDPVRHMPNSIYFGDVQVPMNVLYEYEEENIFNSEENNSVEDINSEQSQNDNIIRRHPRNIVSARSELEKLKACVKAANIKVKYDELFQDYENDEQKVYAIRDLLEENGLRGEPTIAKCRRLKKIVKVKKEITSLDTAVIIEGSGRLLRSAGVKHKSNSSCDLYGQELLRKTMNTIRNLVDTDSD